MNKEENTINNVPSLSSTNEEFEKENMEGPIIDDFNKCDGPSQEEMDKYYDDQYELNRINSEITDILSERKIPIDEMKYISNLFHQGIKDFKDILAELKSLKKTGIHYLMFKFGDEYFPVSLKRLYGILDRKSELYFHYDTTALGELYTELAEELRHIYYAEARY